MRKWGQVRGARVVRSESGRVIGRTFPTGVNRWGYESADRTQAGSGFESREIAEERLKRSLNPA